MKLKLVLTALFIAIYIFSFYSQAKYKDEKINIILDEQIKDLEVHYSVTMDYFIQDVKGMRHNLLNNKKVISLFSQAQNATKDERKVLRDKLYRLLTPMYKRINSRGIFQFQFVFPNNITFLRMHKPDKYGDDLTNIRYSFAHTNKTKETVIGFEQGKTTHAFRYTYPVYDKKGNHLGALETSLGSNTVQEKLSNVNKIHSHFLVNKKVFETNIWEGEDLKQNYIQSIEHKDYMFTLTKGYSDNKLKNMKNNIIKHLEDKIDQKISTKNPFSVYHILEDTAKIITFLPIKNTQEKEISAYIVSYTTDKNIYTTHDDFVKYNIIRFFGLFLIFYFIYKNLNRKNELEIEVAKQTKELKELNENLEQKIIIEVEKNKHIQEQLFKSEKLASMGDMIGNIAHQWRQPLSVISTGATGMKMQKEYNVLTDELFIQTCDAINDNAQYLSKTIDDFRNFIKGDRNKTIFSLKNNIDGFLHLVEGPIKSHNINIILNLQEDIKIDGYENELTQCLINIFNNAKEELIKKDTNVSFDSTNKKNYNNEDRLIFITTKKIDKKVIISIKDNAGGIPEDILPKIFEPYFTTKHKSQGTGLGLHMTYNLIVDGMNGTIEATNVNYEHANKEYIGAEFSISLPV
ncbi:MAG: ATP-binding protein [Campylobacterota bacterium]|nr:ATP-binding protein [Campylobacterota bacterium]